jgi:hypothetical protein
MPFPLPGEESPILDPITGLPQPPAGTTNPVAPVTPPKKTPGRLLFDKFNAGETRFTSLRYTDTRDGFNKQMDKFNPYQLFPPTGYIGISPNEKQAASNHGVRISDFLKTSRGQKFITKQVGLQLSNTRLEDINLFSTTINEASKKLGLKEDLFGGIGNVSISPSTILSVVNIVNDVKNNGFSENTILSATSLIARKQSRSAISPLQNYNFQNTIDQAGSDPNIGWNHYDRFGASNIMSDNDKYWYIVRQNNGSEDLSPTNSPNNRLVRLSKELSVGGGVEIDPLTKLTEKVTKAYGKVRSFTNKVSSYYNQGLGLFNALGNNNQARDFQPINNAISDGFNFVNNKLALADKFIAPFINNVIDQYDGGPNSINGIGPTIIKRYDNTKDTDKTKRILNVASVSLRNKRNLLTGDSRNDSTYPTQISIKYQDDTGIDLFKDSDSGIFNITKREIVTNVYDHGSQPNYETIRKTNLPPKKLSVGPIEFSDKTWDYTFVPQSTEEIKIDKSKKSKYKYFGKVGKGKYGKFTNFDRFIPITANQKSEYNNSVNRVVFTPINPFTGTPFTQKDKNGKIIDGSGRLYFDAYISNFKDNYSPTWNDINYIGRSETFHVFTKFVRDVSFTLQIPCFDPTQLVDRHQALSSLASVNAGFYSENAPLGTTGNQKMGGVITYLRLGKYFGSSSGAIDGEPGIITNFSITVPNDASWDIDKQLAHYLTVDVGFKVIHNALPQHSSNGFLGHLGSPLLSYKQISIQEQYELDQAEELRNSALEAQNQALTAGQAEQDFLYQNAENFDLENFGKGKKFTEKELLDTQGGRFEEFEGDLVPAENDWKYGSF